MLRIGKLTDYAMLILSHLAKEPNTIISATTLAEILRLSAPTVSKILKILSDANFVHSVRGAEGGYHLARPPEEINLADIITTMEGEWGMTQCCEDAERCALTSTCAIRENWQKINKMIHSFLAGLTIVDMMGPDLLLKELVDVK